jgi:hypothetical protein
LPTQSGRREPSATLAAPTFYRHAPQPPRPRPPRPRGTTVRPSVSPIPVPFIIGRKKKPFPPAAAPPPKAKRSCGGAKATQGSEARRRDKQTLGVTATAERASAGRLRPRWSRGSIPSGLIRLGGHDEQVPRFLPSSPRPIRTRLCGVVKLGGGIVCCARACVANLGWI